MTEDLSFDDLSPALLGIEYLILALDYAMWLHIAYVGQPDDAPVSLVQGPEQEHSAIIEEYLSAHREELSVRCLKCQRCGWEEWDLRRSHCAACGGEDLKRVPEEDEKRIRGWAWDALIWSVPGAQARYDVPNWIMQELGSEQSPSVAECQLPKTLVMSRLLEYVRGVKRRYIRKCWEHLYIGDTWGFLPQGASLHEKHQNYLVTREKLTAGYNWLTGIAHQCPEFMEDCEQQKGIRRFPPALPMPAAKTAPSSDASRTTLQRQSDQKNKKKRSTVKGEGREKIIAALTLHHKYRDGGCLNLEPSGVNELARPADVSPSSVTEFFKQTFKGHKAYGRVCLDPGWLADYLKALNDEFALHELFGRKPPTEGPDREDD